MYNWELVEDLKIKKKIYDCFRKKKPFLLKDVILIILFVLSLIVSIIKIYTNIAGIEMFLILTLIFATLNFVNLNKIIMVKQALKKKWFKTELYKIDGKYINRKRSENEFYPDYFVVETQQGEVLAVPLMENMNDITIGTHVMVFSARKYGKDFDKYSTVAFLYDDFSQI